jgi:hypothetical protein
VSRHYAILCTCVVLNCSWSVPQLCTVFRCSCSSVFQSLTDQGHKSCRFRIFWILRKTGPELFALGSSGIALTSEQYAAMAIHLVYLLFISLWMQFWFLTFDTKYIMRDTYWIFVGKPEGKKPLGRPRRRWKDNIKMDLRRIWLVDVKCIHLAQDRDRWRAVVNTVHTTWKTSLLAKRLSALQRVELALTVMRLKQNGDTGQMDTWLIDWLIEVGN